MNYYFMFLPNNPPAAVLVAVPKPPNPTVDGAEDVNPLNNDPPVFVNSEFG